MGFDAPLPFDLPTAISQVTGGDGSAPGGFADDVELANAAYGQAETFVTPLQMALVASTVANDGVLMTPHLVTSMTGKRSGTHTFDPSRMATVIDSDDAQAINAAMVAGGRGRRSGGSSRRGRRSRACTTAGKSGTAELGGTGEPHSWFIGFAPAEAPTVAIAVLVEQAGRGGEVAAPIAGDLMTRYLARATDGRPGPAARTRAAARAATDHRADRAGRDRTACWRSCSAASRSRRGSAASPSWR